jgi:hypothetical protein
MNRVCTGHGKPANSWNFIISKSTPGNPGKSVVVMESHGNFYMKIIFYFPFISHNNNMDCSWYLCENIVNDSFHRRMERFEHILALYLYQHVRIPAMDRAFFNYITTGVYTPVGPLLAPVVKHDFQMSWALLIISKRLTLLKMLHLPVFSYPLTFSTLIPSYKSGHR